MKLTCETKDDQDDVQAGGDDQKVSADHGPHEVMVESRNNSLQSMKSVRTVQNVHTQMQHTWVDVDDHDAGDGVRVDGGLEGGEQPNPLADLSGGDEHTQEHISQESGAKTLTSSDVHTIEIECVQCTVLETDQLVWIGLI